MRSHSFDIFLSLNNAENVVVVLLLLNPFRGMGRGGTTWRPNRQATP